MRVFMPNQRRKRRQKRCCLSKGIHFAGNHDLERLIGLIRQNDETFPLFAEASATLNEYGVDARYDPRTRDEITRDETQAAIVLAETVMEQCRRSIDT